MPTFHDAVQHALAIALMFASYRTGTKDGKTGRNIGLKTITVASIGILISLGYRWCSHWL